MKIRSIILSVSLCTVVGASSLPLLAQLSLGGIPSNISTSSELRSASFGAEKVITLPAPPRAEIERLLEEESLGAPLVRATFRMGIPQEVDLSPSNSGTLSYDNEGRLIWELAIRSERAAYLQLFFDRYSLEEGSRLFVLSPERNIVRGAFGAHNNTESNSLAIAPVAGEQLVVRYESPKGDYSLPNLHIGSVSYGFRSLMHETAGVYKPGEPWFVGGIDCAPNIVTHPELDNVSRSLVLVVARGSVVFSGALINNTAENGEAYVLTASHCLNGSFSYANNQAYRENTARQCVFYFNFRSPTGNVLTRPSEEQTLSGAEIVAWDEDHDLCLLRITGVEKEDANSVGRVPASYRPYFAGWNAGEHNPPYTAIHHPQASTARYTRCDSKIPIVDYDVKNKVWTNAHYHIDKWAVGTTAGGSSGSPLLDPEGRIIGGLTGGSSYCNTPFNDYYFAISRCWEGANMSDATRLQPWLDPKSTGKRNLGGLDPYAPLNPQRLSHNLYSLRRDSIERTAEYVTRISGVRTFYHLSDSSRVLGLKIVATTGGTFPSGDITLYSGDAKGPKEEIYTTKLRHPNYTHLGGKAPRTLGGDMEFFVPIPQNVTLAKDAYLYISVTGAKDNSSTPLQLPILRSKQLPRSGNSTQILPLGASLWQESNSGNLPSDLQYTGSFWIDAIVQPIQNGNSKEEDPAKERPFVVLLDNTMRIVLPKGGSGKTAVVSLYTILGERLCRVTTSQSVTDVSLPRLDSNKWVLWSIEYNGKVYRNLTQTF